MPSHSTRHTIARQWQLLKLLPNRHPGLTSTQLQKALADTGHETSKRTVERDLIELSALFPLQCNDKGMPYGWYWQVGRNLALPGISLGEAMTLQLVEDSIRPLIPAQMFKSLEPRFNEARQKLKALADTNGSAQWMDKVASVQPSLNLLVPDIDPEVLEQVQHALLDDRQIQVRYYSVHKDQTSELQLNPLGLVQRGQISYLVATAVGFSDVRLYVLHRIQSLQPLATASQKPADFELAAYIDSGALQFGIPRQISLLAWVDDSLARRLLETPLSDDMQLNSLAEGGAELQATVNDSWELMWWLLSHAGSIKVRAPESLRSNMLEKLRQSLALHDQ
ncbi:WYL domain-containing protein [Pseudomonas sp. Teo4]|uniref:helix-turn-helix transcriptional regulator n=1 Tax=Pseudomonas sp. Teo4 TaxID=3064528 RepID=UPI002ABB7BC1|nr:WYL domain-containing protein [Pseudomonas sp. Teo4]MDZ3990980.1 hypothetical protein [Pseudomonas sp. Teo4]